jgi:hypothetical protein
LANDIKIKAFIQYDFSVNYLREANWTISDSLGQLFFEFKAGKFLTPALDSLASQKSRPTPRDQLAMDKFSTYLVGIRLDATYRGTLISLASHGDNGIVLTTRKDGLTLFWEKDAGHGLVAKLEGSGRFIHPLAGIAWDTHGNPSAFLQNYVQLPIKTRFYGQLDYDGEKNKDYPLVGLTHVYSKHSFVKLYYDGLGESVKAETTFAF